MRGAALAALCAVALATALDWSVGAALGYRLRADAPLLLAIDAALLAPVVLGGLALLGAVGRIPGWTSLARRLPGTRVIAAATAPLLVFALRRAELLGLGFAVASGIAIVACAAFEWRRPLGARAAVLCLAVSGAALAWLASPPPPGVAMVGALEAGEAAPATPEAPNLILIVLDTLRADHLGVYGYARPVSPWLDRFAAGATVFERAISPSSWTLPPHATLFTGLYPRSHGAYLVDGEVGLSLSELGRLEDAARARPLSPEAVTLAELAREAGIETAAMCANSGYLYRVFGLNQGFDTYVDPRGNDITWRPIGLSLGDRIGLRDRWRFAHLVESNDRYYLLASEINDLALRWLEPRRQRRFLLFLNYMDPHAPYLPVGRYRRLFPDAWSPQDVDYDAVRSLSRDLSADERAQLVDAYDAEIRYLDDHLAQLFETLESWGLMDRTLVVIVGDHGEALGEHRELGHGNGVYQPEVRVPLIMREPGQRHGERVERRVHLVDVAPTLIRRLGLRVPAGLQGGALDDSGNGRPHAIVTYTGRYQDLARAFPDRYDRTHQALFSERWKLIRHSDGDTELYDLERDPNETVDLAERRPEVVARLSAELERFDSEVTPRFESGASQGADAETQERLRTLGYAD